MEFRLAENMCFTAVMATGEEEEEEEECVCVSQDPSEPHSSSIS